MVTTNLITTFNLCSIYRIRQNIRGGKLSRFSRILAKRESFTIESFPSSQLEFFYHYTVTITWRPLHF